MIAAGSPAGEGVEIEPFSVELLRDGAVEAAKTAALADTAIVFVGNHPLLVAKEEIDLKIIKDSAKIKRRLITKEVVGAVVTLPNEGRAVFKVLEDRLERAPARRSAIEEEDEVRTLSDGGRGSGCVCHQSAVLTTERLRELIAEEAKGEPTAIAAAQKVSDKRTLCELYELVLRKHRASALVP